MLSLLDICINEVCLHSSLWTTSFQSATAPCSLIRLKMLHRTMEGATTYIRTLLQAPQSLLPQLGLGSWSAWFYAFVVICKLVFLEENERSGNTEVDDIPGEIDNLLPHDHVPENPITHSREDQPPSDKHVYLGELADGQGWNALVVAREYNIRELFDQVMAKLRYILPEGSVPWRRAKEQRENLYAIACLHHTMHQGFTKRINQLALASASSSTTIQSATGPTTSSRDYSSTERWQTLQSKSASSIPPVGPTILPFANFMNFDSINFEGLTETASAFPPQGEEILGDWMWNMVMDDFTMPIL
jgi:hypothetical protein